MSSEELKPCPFCGSPAKSDNGFSPAESITYAWCSNTECQLHSVDVGMTPSDWNQRALPNVDPQPPTVSVTWHESPESVHRAMWEEVAVAEGMTYEQLIAESEGEGETETGETVSFTHEQELAGMRGQGCWAFVDARTNTIHAWADEATPRELVLHMLAHEIGHITGEPHPDDMQEEMRAEQFGRVAKMAYGLLPARAQLAAIQGGMVEEVEVRGLQWLDTGHYRKKPPQFGYNPHDWNPLMTVAQHQRITAAMAAEGVEWIACSERLPNEVEWCLVFADGAMNCMAFNNGNWEDWVSAALPNIRAGEITHWMPLPAAPALSAAQAGGE